MKKNKILIVFLIIILIIQTINPKKNIKSQKTKIELKYDTDKYNGHVALSRNDHLVHFFPVKEKLTIDKVKIHCNKSDIYNRNPMLYILNNNYKLIYKKEVKNVLFKTKPDWVEIETDKITVEKDFYIMFITNSGKGDSIYVSYTTNKNQNHSNQGTVKAKNTWNLSKFDINYFNWKVRVEGNYADKDTKLSEPIIKENFDSKEQAAQYLDTHEKLAEWMEMNLTYKSKYGIKADSQYPEDTLKLKTGNCHDLSIFSFYILNQNGYDPLFFNIQFKNDSARNHIITLFKKGSKFYSIDNTALRGPYKNFEEIAKVYGKDWWKYIIYNSIEDTIIKKNAVKTVYR